MNAFNILWIDDDWSSQANNEIQRSHLGRLKLELETKNPLIRVTTRESIAEGIVAFFHNRKFDFNLLIVDLEYENEESDNTFELIIENAEAKLLPIVIFSNNPNDIVLKEILSKPHPLVLECFYKKDMASNSFLEYIQALARQTQVNILHISDFHFDSTLSAIYQKEQLDMFDQLALLLEAKNKLSPFDVLVFSGDFASKNPKADFEGCLPFIQKIVLKTTNDYSKLLIVPGNHDIEWENFATSEISSMPAKHFYDFLSRLYIQNFEVISNLVGYNTRVSSFDEHYEPDSFCWSKTIPGLNLEIIGLNSTTALPEFKGLGKVGNKVIAFIKREWDKPIKENYVRIAIVHHNVLPPFSINKLDESTNILNAGEFVQILVNHGCTLLLSGHCHDSYLYNFSYSVLNHKGFSELKHLSYISTGTAGGFSGSYDRAKSFNIISFIPSANSKEKKIIVNPYLYDSREKKWIGVEKLSTSLPK